MVSISGASSFYYYHTIIMDTNFNVSMDNNFNVADIGSFNPP